MTPDPVLVQRGLVAVLIGVACYTDITTQKIKNWLTLPTMAVGLLLGWWLLGAWWSGLGGVAVGLAATFFPWRMGAIKAGDVKMLMAAGALLGPHAALLATLWTLILAIPAGLAVLAWRRRLGNIKRVLVDGRREEATVVAHAPVVGAGIVAAMLWPDLL